MNRSAETVGKCVWMDAGVLTYKLCDRSFECDRCPLDNVLRKDELHPDPIAGARAGKHFAIDVPLPVATDVQTAQLLGKYSSTHLCNELTYSRDHAWVRLHDTKLAMIGIDHLFVALLPFSARIVYPPVKVPVERGRPMAWIYTHSCVMPVFSPLSGVVVRQNRRLSEDPGFLRSHTYDLGWLASIIPSRLDAEQDALLTAEQMRPISEEALGTFMRRAHRKLHSHAQPGGLCLNDGGVVMPALDEALGERAFVELARSVLFPRQGDPGITP